MANRVIKKVGEAAIVGATTIALCKLGDSLILEETSKVYTKKDADGKTVPKGVGFPTSISIGSIICHNSPLESDPVVALKVKTSYI